VLHCGWVGGWCKRERCGGVKVRSVTSSELVTTTSFCLRQQ
jgi:hypothetical protein